jgi:hypothetical protein
MVRSPGTATAGRGRRGRVACARRHRWGPERSHAFGVVVIAATIATCCSKAGCDERPITVVIMSDNLSIGEVFP